MPQNSHYAAVADLPVRIPVFPLRGCILLPDTTLPLNIFEPRYLAMINAVIAGDRVLGIVQPDPSAPHVESPDGKVVPLRRVGGLGRLVAFQEQDDGRYLIKLQGVSRFEIEKEIESSAPFRTCDVSYGRFARDLCDAESEADIDRPELIRSLKKFFHAKGLTVDWSGIAHMTSEELVNALSMAGPYGPEEKQALIEAGDLKSRSEILVALATMALAGGSHGGASDKLQ